MEFKLVIGGKDGKCHQVDIKSPEADHLHKRVIGDKIKGDVLGFDGYEFEITGGSDKAGFPMRKGIQFHRKKVLTGKGVGFSGKKRNKEAQKGLLKRRTVCGERITGIIRQVNVKIVKEGKGPLVAAPETAPEGDAPQEAPAADANKE